MWLKTFVSTVITLLVITHSSAQTGPYADWNRDIKGSRDHPLVGRYEGSVIAGYLQRDNVNTRVLTQLPVRLPQPHLESPKQSWTDKNSMALTGRMTQLIFRVPDKKRTPLELFANYKQSFSAQSYELLLECRNIECYPSQNPLSADGYMANVLRVNLIDKDDEMLRAIGWTNSPTDLRYAVFRRGTNIIALTTFSNVHNGGASYAWFQVVEGAPPAAKVPSAAEMIGNLTRTGKQALYSIYFDTGQAVVKPESNPTFEQIASMLASNPQLNIIVTGHTDNVGEFDSNIGLIDPTIIKANWN